jgi:hypothetical protein
MIYCIAIEPPGNIAREICLIRNDIFRTYGAASAKSLPPLIPLTFSSLPPNEDSFQEAASIEAGLIQTSTCEWHKNAFFLTVSASPSWNDIAGTLQRGVVEHEPFPPYQGFFLAMREEENMPPVDVCAHLNRMGTQLQWRDSVLSCLQLRTASGKAWWKHVVYERIFSEPLRTR